MVTRRAAGISRPMDRLQLSAAAAPPTLSPVPSSIRSALTGPHWRDTMEEEYEAQLSNNMWDLVPQSTGANVVTGKWIFKYRLKEDDSPDRYKPHWVLQGSLNTPRWTTMRPSTVSSSLPPSGLCWLWQSLGVGPCTHLTSRTPSLMAHSPRLSPALSLPASLTLCTLS
jgi:hypothetical protein